MEGWTILLTVRDAGHFVPRIDPLMLLDFAFLCAPFASLRFCGEGLNVGQPSNASTDRQMATGGRPGLVSDLSPVCGQGRVGPPIEAIQVTDLDFRVRIDKWLWAGAPDSLATCRPFAGRGALGRPLRQYK